VWRVEGEHEDTTKLADRPSLTLFGTGSDNRGGMELNDHLRQMLKELGQAINESISGSGRVHESIQRIREEGYNLYMVLDAKVGVNRRETRAGSRRPAQPSAPHGSNTSERASFRINVKDLRFLKSLGIDPTRKVRNRAPAARRVRAPLRASRRTLP
jgi:hypothetical protein